MAKPWIHSLSSARKFGGKPEDYLAIHEFLDASKGTIADNRHRALTHNAWFLSFVLPRVFGDVRANSGGRVYSVRDVGEQHVLEDFGGAFIPSAQDYLAELPLLGWMQNGLGRPPSAAKLAERKGKKYVIVD